MPEQSYQNHPHRPTGFLVVSLLAFLTLIGSVVNLYQSWGDHQRLYSASLILVLAVCALVTPSIVRLSILKAQDRAVRAEESLRYYIATGKPLDPRLKSVRSSPCDLRRMPSTSNSRAGPRQRG